MRVRIRKYQAADEGPVVELSLLAWTPVFASLERQLGHELFVRLHGDWRQYQASAVREVLSDEAIRVWVAMASDSNAIDRVAGFVAGTLHVNRLIGEIVMLAVRPDEQNHGIGTALTEFATDWLRGAGMRVAMIETGGDEGHAPARRCYERSDYRPLPVVRYFKSL
ncbi:MAG: GNAT family N-acetyltransferase [Nocardiopsaceae bacterium]|jgi:GNAT superfamily N-acetyltransferase|nr:GNAT family N-acetyltransferase [Nocardiopsaceae bacterium]